MSSWTDLTREPLIPWERIKAGWSSGWKGLEAQALHTYEAMIVREPEAFRPSVEAFFAEMEAARQNIERTATKIHALPTEEQPPFRGRLTGLLDRWRTLAAGALAQAQPSVAGPPVVLIVVGVIVGVAAIAWAVAAYQYAVNLREQTALTEKELDARILASKEGRSLPATTLPVQPKPGFGAATWLVVAGLVAGAAALGPKLLQKARGTS